METVEVRERIKEVMKVPVKNTVHLLIGGDRDAVCCIGKNEKHPLTNIHLPFLALGGSRPLNQGHLGSLVL